MVVSRHTVRTLGRVALGIGGLLTLAGICMYVVPGPGLPTLIIGLGTLGVGGLLIGLT